MITYYNINMKNYFFLFEKTFFKVSAQNFCYHDVISLSLKSLKFSIVFHNPEL